MRKHKPREKLAAEGAAALSDAELLAVLLGAGTGRMPVLELANDLLERFGGLRGLLAAGQQSLLRHHGLGPAKAAKLLAVLELARRHLQELLVRGDPLESPEVTERYLKTVLRDHPHDLLCVPSRGSGRGHGQGRRSSRERSDIRTVLHDQAHRHRNRPGTLTRF